MDEIGEDRQAEITEDDYEEPSSAESRTQFGCIYQLGKHRLMCGDSTDPDSMKMLMGGALADMVFTDPPYGVAIGDKNAMLNEFQRCGRCTEK